MTLSPHDTLVKNLAKHLAQVRFAQTPNQIHLETAQIVKTHISSVILVGCDAYKLKRDIKLPFLDFSSIQKRHQYCLLEMQVNQRTAAKIYLDVLPITGTLNNPELNGTGALLDWAVHMRRFEPDQLLSELSEHGQLSLEIVSDLAQHIAQFHLNLKAQTPEDLIHVRPTQSWLLESLDEIATLCTDRKNILQDIDTLRTNAMTQWNRNREFRNTRAQDGWVRECHGDLHLANVTCFKGQVMAFDAIEFNQDLRKIDLINEIAFTFMDLFAHELPGHAWQFLNTYLQRTGDYAGLAQLKYFTRYRATIRAKVALLSQDPTDPVQSQQQNLKFERYWSIACSPPFGTPIPTLVLVAGLSGSGKSTVAEMLSQHWGAVWVRADVERKRLYTEPDLALRYSRHATDQTYTCLVNVAQELMDAGLNVVIDATFLDGHQIEKFQKMVKARLNEGKSSRIQSIVCQSNEATLKQRIVKRNEQGDDPSEATVDVLAAQAKRLSERPVRLPNLAWTLVNDGSLDDLAHKVHDIALSLHSNHEA